MEVKNKPNIGIQIMGLFLVHMVANMYSAYEGILKCTVQQKLKGSKEVSVDRSSFNL